MMDSGLGLMTMVQTWKFVVVLGSEGVNYPYLGFLSAQTP
jgi:hypothetical protein